MTAADKWIKLDNVSVTVSEQVNGAPVKTVLLAEDFDDIDDPRQLEASDHYAYKLGLQVSTEDGSWQTLDKFVVNDAGKALVGCRTGNEITEQGGTLSYSGGALDDVKGSVEFWLISNTLAGIEVVRFDILSVTQTSQGAAQGKAVVVDFEELNAGDVIAEQFDGLSISTRPEPWSASTCSTSKSLAARSICSMPMAV